MARTRTLAQLRTEVRQRADIENDPHITDTEVNRFVNQSCAALHALLVDMDESFFLKSATVVTVAGTATYNLTSAASDFYKLAYVMAQVGGIWIPLGRWTYEQATLYANSPTWGLAQVPITYRISYDQSSSPAAITFAPVPDGAYIVSIQYVRYFADMSSDTDTFDGLDGWEEWVVLDAAVKCLVKEESDTSAMVLERDQVMQRIASQMRSQDLDRPGTIRDVTGWNPYMRKQVFT